MDKDNLRHDLRNHLSAIKLTAEVAILNPAINEEIKKTLHTILQEVNEMSEILKK